MCARFSCPRLTACRGFVPPTPAVTAEMGREREREREWEREREVVRLLSPLFTAGALTVFLRTRLAWIAEVEGGWGGWGKMDTLTFLTPNVAARGITCKRCSLLRWQLRAERLTWTRGSGRAAPSALDFFSARLPDYTHDPPTAHPPPSCYCYVKCKVFDSAV